VTARRSESLGRIVSDAVLEHGKDARRLCLYANCQRRSPMARQDLAADILDDCAMGAKHRRRHRDGDRITWRRIGLASEELSELPCVSRDDLPLVHLEDRTRCDRGRGARYALSIDVVELEGLIAGCGSSPDMWTYEIADLARRRGQEYVRDGQLPASQHRHQAGPVEERPAHHARLQDGSADTAYCLEGSIAITGALVQWLRDNLGMIEKSSDIEVLAKTVDDNGGAYFVPAFSGLYAPYWKSSARGVIAGLTRYVNKGHIARAALEATAWQTREIVDAMNADSGVALTSLKVDGGMVFNDTLMQFQSDVLGVPVVRPTGAETTSLGAAYAAGLAVGFWAQVEDLRENWGKDKKWTPHMDKAAVDHEYALWKKAVTRTFDWVE